MTQKDNCIWHGRQTPALTIKIFIRNLIVLLQKETSLGMQTGPIGVPYVELFECRKLNMNLFLRSTNNESSISHEQ